jgi:hypothetical protein
LGQQRRLHELQGAGRASDAPSMENFGQKTLSSHAIQGSDGIAWGSALPVKGVSKVAVCHRHVGEWGAVQYRQASPAGQPHR